MTTMKLGYWTFALIGLSLIGLLFTVAPAWGETSAQPEQQPVWTERFHDPTAHLYNLHFVNNTVGYAVGGPSWDAGGGDGRIYKTTDGGYSWLPQANPARSWLRGIDCKDANTCWAAGRFATVLRTTDGGATWRNASVSGYSGWTYNARHVQDDIVLVGGTCRVILRAVDGFSFIPIDPGGCVVQWEIDCPTPSLCVSAANQRRFYRSTNQGASWQQRVTDFGQHWRGVSFIDNSNGWAVDNTGMVARSTNGGVNWSHIATISPGLQLNHIKMIDQLRGWVIGDHGAVFYTDTGGSSWQFRGGFTTAELTGLHVFGPNHVWVTSWDGRIWQYAPPSDTPPPPTPTPTPLPDTVILQNGGSGTYYGTSDTYIRGSAQNQNDNYGDATAIYLNGPGSDVRSILLRFDLSQFHLTRELRTARIEIHTRSGEEFCGAPTTVHAYKLNRAWVDREATWLKASDTANWAQPGAKGVPEDRDATPVTTTVMQGAGNWHAWQMTDLVRFWLENPSQNYGILLEVAEGGICKVDSAEWIPEVRPRLVMELGEALPTPTPTTTPTPTSPPTPTPTATPTATPTPLTGEVFGYIFHDQDGTGSYHPGQPGIPGVVVQVSQSGNLAGEATSNVEGYYSIRNLQPGQYRVAAGTTEGYTSNGPNPIFVVIGQSDRLQMNFPYIQATPSPGTISGTVYVDVDRTGTRDSQDPGVPNVRLRLHVNADQTGGTDPVGDPLATALTNPMGNYAFSGVPPGHYVVIRQRVLGYDPVQEMKPVVITDGSPPPTDFGLLPWDRTFVPDVRREQ